MIALVLFLALMAIAYAFSCVLAAIFMLIAAFPISALILFILCILLFT